MEDHHLTVRDLVFGYKKNTPILDQLNMSIPKGSIYGFLGKNGTGKTTSIRNMLGLLKPNSGSITLNGKRVLEKVGLIKYGKLKSKKYSTGMKQRLGLAMALIHEPELLILDEPIRGLDPTGIQEIRNLIFEINKQGTTIILSSHILSEIDKLVSHIGLIENGRLKFEGTYNRLLQHIDESTTMKIRSNDPVLLQKYLSKHFDANLNGVWVKIPYHTDQQTAKLVNELVENGFDIYEIEKEKNELESIFLDMTDNKEN